MSLLPKVVGYDRQLRYSDEEEGGCDALAPGAATVTLIRD